MIKFALQHRANGHMVEISDSLDMLDARIDKRFRSTKRGNEQYYKTAWYKANGGRKTVYTFCDYMLHKQRVQINITPIDENGKEVG
jgi:hypothetical protein